MKFFIKDFLSKCDQINSFLRIWSHLLKKSFMKDFIFCALRAITKWYLQFWALIFVTWDLRTKASKEKFIITIRTSLELPYIVTQ